MDDANVLAYSTSTEENCRILENLHKECEGWAKRHGAIFAPKEYHLIHLAKNPRNFNMAAAIKIDCSEDSAIINPETEIRVLGLQIDTKLQWGPHIKGIQKKMTKQSLALSRISTSTWGATFAKARHVYTAVVRPAMTYGSAAWHLPAEVGKTSRTIESKMAVLQNKCLRTVSGAFKATPIKALDAETPVAPLSLHLNCLQAKARARMRATGQSRVIAKQCKKIEEKLKNHVGRARIPTATPGAQKTVWAKSLDENFAQPRPLPLWPPWSDETEEYGMRRTEALQDIRKQEASIKTHFEKDWTDEWDTYRKLHSLDPTAAQTLPLNKKRIQLHATMAKAESSLATQIRTEKIGLAAFLYHRKVPGIPTAACQCGWPKQTAKHVIMFLSSE